MPLTIHQSKALRRLAHALKPVVMIGQKGLTENVVNEIDQALEHHELIKVRISATDKTERLEFAESIAQTTKCEMVQLIGHIGIFYRCNPKRNSIQLPKK